ncbi:interaptin-like [Phalaenopsis equestris]|uniref:interaptin-like n=1 Tax=Phalaenopsis equestris TaxID=78828 RepID=UPI0009E2CA72|nr:interaptin-like [Phalaenopsis equestris]XP_020596909.1 interaptin-like [Phalaenopsis equestris]
MGQQKSPRLCSDVLIWNQIYKKFKEMLKFQQSQIETLINDREFFENSFYIQHKHWSSKARFLESQIAKMKEEQANTRLVEVAKMGVLVGFKESEALCYKTQLELAENDLEEFRSCVEALSVEMENTKEKLKGFGAIEVKNVDYMIDPTGSLENSKGRNQLTLSLKQEIKKLKQAYRELSSRRDTEVSALLAEKDFVWNQFRKIESDYIALVKTKHTEADHQAMETIEKLQDNVNKLQQTIEKKDELIVKLEAERSILELDVRKHAEKAEQANNKMKRLHADLDEHRLAAMENEKIIDKLRKELHINKFDKPISSDKIKCEGKFKIGSAGVRQIHLQRCSRKRNLESYDTYTSQKHANSSGITCETPACNNVHKPQQNLTEKKRTYFSPADVKPSLFHSDFKVPKLKKFRPLP